MSVGETLTEARNHAGLSVEELSERTRIRGTVIRSIESDDYAACGGDLYVRGYVRAIAGAVGIDAQPLIREFDADRAGGRHSLGYPLPDEPAAAAPEAAATAFDLPAITDGPAGPDGRADADDPDATRYDLPRVTDGPATTRFDLPVVAPPAPPAAARRPRRRAIIGAVAVVAVLGTAGALAISLSSGGGQAAAPSAQASAPASAAAAKASAAAQASAAATAKASAAAQASQAATGKAAAKRAAASPVVALPVASASAFGPGGFADGDNAGNAGYAIARHPAAPWTTQWYVTPTYGMLKHGTGLLLDLGRTVTVTSVRADLSQYRGATMQLRAGNRAQLADLRVAATAGNAAGVARLTLRHPVTARYLLLWFTVLPSDGAGHYQESVAQVTVSGHR